MTYVDMVRLEELKAARQYANEMQTWNKLRGAVQPEGVDINDRELYYMGLYLEGSRMPAFDPSISFEPFKALSEELGFRVVGLYNVFPFRAHNVDPEVKTWANERFTVWFAPTGELYQAKAAGRHYTLNLAHEDYNTSAEMQAVLFYMMKTQRKNELQFRERELAETNASRAKHGVKPITESWVDSVLNR